MRTSRCTSWIYKRQRKKRSNCQHLLDHPKSYRISEKKPSTSASLTTQKSLTVRITTILKENPVNPKDNQSWIFIGRTDAEAEAQILWPPDARSQLIRKAHDAGKDWRQEKGMTKDKMVGWQHQLNGHEFEQTLGDGEGQGSLVCCSPWGLKESDKTEQLNNKNTLLKFCLLIKLKPEQCTLIHQSFCLTQFSYF